MKNQIEQLNELLRGEISSVETYGQAIGALKDSHHLNKIREMEKEHQSAVSQLKAKVVEHGGSPVESSGPWGAWAKLVTGTAALISESAIFKVLKEGEEHGVKEYRELEKINLNFFNSPFVIERLSKQTQHIETLNALLS